MRKYITLFFSVSVFLFSCSGDKTPDGVINHKIMTNLLTEVHIIDGRMYTYSQTQDSLNRNIVERFNGLFKRYHTDSAQFKKSLKYYATQPTELAAMYEQVMDNLKKKTDSLNNTKPKNALPKQQR